LSKNFSVSSKYMQKKKFLKFVNLKVPKNKIGQKKDISNFSTNPKQNKNYNNTNKNKKTY